MARIKSITLGILQVLIIFLMLYKFTTDISNHQQTNLWVLAIGPIAILAFMPFQNVIELISDSQFATYRKIGPIKFNKKVYAKPGLDKVAIEQDDKRYYCLAIHIPAGPILVIERYPTLDNAERRIILLRQTLQ